MLLGFWVAQIGDGFGGDRCRSRRSTWDTARSMFLGFCCEAGFLLASPVLLGFCCDIGFFFFFFFLIWVFLPVGFWWVVGSGGMVGMVEVRWW